MTTGALRAPSSPLRKHPRESVRLLARGPRVFDAQLLQVDRRDDVGVGRRDPRALPVRRHENPDRRRARPEALLEDARVLTRDGVAPEGHALDERARRAVEDADVARPREADDRALAVESELHADRELSGLDRGGDL